MGCRSKWFYCFVAWIAGGKPTGHDPDLNIPAWDELTQARRESWNSFEACLGTSSADLTEQLLTDQLDNLDTLGLVSLKQVLRDLMIDEFPALVAAHAARFEIPVSLETQLFTELQTGLRDIVQSTLTRANEVPQFRTTELVRQATAEAFDLTKPTLETVLTNRLDVAHGG